MAKENRKREKERIKGSFTEELGDIVKSYIFPIIAVIGLGLMTYFVYVPYVRKLPVILDEQKMLDQNIQTLDANLAKLQEYNMMPLDTMASKLDELIPTEAKVAELFNTLTLLASQAGIEVTIPVEDENGENVDEAAGDEGVFEDIIAGETDTGAEYQIKRIPVRLTFSGNKAQVATYLNSIRDESRVLSIETASISVIGELWQVELVVNGYRGEVLMTSLPDSTTIDSESEKVLLPISLISSNLTDQYFTEVIYKF